MRVLHVCTWFPVRSETFVHGKVLAQLRRGWDVRVLVTDFGSDMAMPLAELGEPALEGRVEHVERSWLRPRPWARMVGGVARDRGLLRCGLGSLLGTAAWTSDWVPDVVHAHFGHRAILAAWLRRLRGWEDTALVASFLGYDVTEMPAEAGLAGMYRRVCAEEIDHMIFTSRFLEDALAATGARWSAGRSIIPVAVDLTRFAPGEHAPRTVPVVVTVARLMHKKALDVAVRAMARVERPFEWRVIGDGPLAGELRAQASAAGLDGKLRWLGALPHERVAAELRDADLFFLPSRREEFGGVFVEAQASGLPCVGTRVGGIPEAVAEDESGLLVPAEDDVAAAAAVTRVLGEPALHARLRAGALAHARQFEAGALEARLDEAYQAALARRRR